MVDVFRSFQLKRLKGKVLKKKNMQPKIPNVDGKDLEGEDDIKVLIAEKMMSSSTEMSSSMNEDTGSPVDLIQQVYPNKSSPVNTKPASKAKNTKKMIPKLGKNSNKDRLPSPQIPVMMNGHPLVSEHSLDGNVSPTPIKCIPRLEKSLSSDSYPEMAPDFGVEDGDAQDIANEGCVPVSDVFNESTTWEMLEKFGEEGSFKDADQAPQSVYMKLEPGVNPASSTGGHALHSSNKGNLPITNEERNARAIHEGNEFMQMTSSESPNKTPSSKAHRHPAARALDGKAGGGSAAMKKREIDNLDNVSVSQKEEKSDSGVAVDTSPAHHNSSHASSNGTESIVQLVPVLKYSQSEWNKMKQEQELEFQTRLLQKEKDWSKKLAERERRITDQEKRIMLLDDQARNLKQSNEDMRHIVAEFEKTIAQLQAEKEKTTSASQESLENLIRERDQALEDLQSVETAFSDLHRRYEKTKNVVEGFKKNEDILKKCVQDYQLKIKRAEQKLLAIRQQAEEKLEQANTEIEKLRRSTSAEIAKLEAALRKSDVQAQSLERTIEQKTLENQELTAICDELIAKVGDVS